MHGSLHGRQHPVKTQWRCQAPEKAYQDDINHAMKRSDDKGNVTILLNCPQPYEDGVTVLSSCSLCN